MFMMLNDVKLTGMHSELLHITMEKDGGGYAYCSLAIHAVHSLSSMHIYLEANNYVCIFMMYVCMCV